MGTNNITENNKMIADFMGFNKAIVINSKGKQYDYNLPNGFELIKEVETTIESVWCEVLEDQDYCMIEDLKFHTSWDWLMPVVKRCSDVTGVIMLGECSDEQWRVTTDLTRLTITTPIETVYMRVVAFIHWHNQQQEATK